MIDLPRKYNADTQEGLTVLIIEDDDDDATEIAEILTDLGCVGTVFRAANGEDADQWVTLAEDQPDLIICDLNMPRVNGFGFLTRLRASRVEPPPVVILTSSNRQGDYSRSLVRQAVTYIQKPHSYNALVEVLTRLMSTLTTGNPLPPRFAA
jgi:CheY-like chemotaxis protein